MRNCQTANLLVWRFRYGKQKADWQASSLIASLDSIGKMMKAVVIALCCLMVGVLANVPASERALMEKNEMCPFAHSDLVQAPRLCPFTRQQTALTGLGAPTGTLVIRA
jgi:hypothetical protein